jgi:hypothetical protein
MQLAPLATLCCLKTSVLSPVCERRLVFVAAMSSSPDAGGDTGATTGDAEFRDSLPRRGLFNYIMDR